MSILAEEFVVKVRADTKGINKSTQELSKQLDKLTKQGSNFGETLASAMTFRKVASGSDLSAEIAKNKKLISEYYNIIDKESKKIKAKGQGVLSFVNSPSSNKIKDEIVAIKKGNKTILSEQQALETAESGGGNIFTMYKNKYQGMLEARQWYLDKLAEMNANEQAYIDNKNSNDPNTRRSAMLAKEQAIRLKREMSVTNELMTKEFGKKWTKLISGEDATKYVDKYTKKINKENKDNKGNSFLGKLGSIALSALVWSKIAKAIQAVVQALKQGVENAYQFSKISKGSLSTAMDNIKSKATAFSNALGAVSANFITAVEPYLIKLLEWLTTVMNKASKMFAELFNLPEYLTANTDIFAEWQSCIKDTKELISGFDELNIFNGNGNNTEIKDMFTTNTRDTTGYESKFAKFGKLISDICDSLKKFLEEIDWEGMINEIGDTIDVISDLYSTLKPILDKLLEAAADIINFITSLSTNLSEGVVGTLTAFLKLFTGEYSWSEFKDAIVKIWQDACADIKKSFRKAMGLDDEESTVQSKVDTAVEKVTGKDSNVSNGLTINGKMVIAPSGKHMENGVAVDNYSGNRLKDMWGYAVEDFNIIKDTISGLVENTKDLWDGITHPARTIKGWFTQNANGGVYTSPTLGLVGEYAGASHNPEIITPTSLLDERLQVNNSNLIEAYVQVGRQIINAINNKDLEVSIGDNVIASACAKGNNNYNKMTGKSLF